MPGTDALAAIQQLLVRPSSTSVVSERAMAKEGHKITLISEGWNSHYKMLILFCGHGKLLGIRQHLTDTLSILARSSVTALVPTTTAPLLPISPLTRAVQTSSLHFVG